MGSGFKPWCIGIPRMEVDSSTIMLEALACGFNVDVDLTHLEKAPQIVYTSLHLQWLLRVGAQGAFRSLQEPLVLNMQRWRC